MTPQSEYMVRALEANVREAVALLDAISVGGMLARPAPAAEVDAQHIAAVALLEVVRKRLVDGLDISRHIQR